MGRQGPVSEPVPEGAVLVSSDGYQHPPAVHRGDVYVAVCGRTGVVNQYGVRPGPVDLPVCPDCAAGRMFGGG